MNARTQLAALDHNHNVGHKQAKRKDGQLRFTKAFAKQKGDWISRKIYDKKRYGYLEDLFADCFLSVEGVLELQQLHSIIQHC